MPFANSIVPKKLSICAMTLFIAAASSGCAQNQKQASHSQQTLIHRPNIVYILADDLGIGDLGSYGQTKIKTPNLDQLAKQGLRFTRHYSGSTVCAPSRASLMTGQHTGNLQIRGNYELGGFLNENEFGQMAIDADYITLAEILQNVEYSTALVGKWGLGGPGSDGVPNKHGFDYFYGYLDQKQAHNYYPTHLWRNENRVELNNPFFVPHVDEYGGSSQAEDYRDYIKEDYTPYLMLDEAKKFIRENHEKPFFLMYSSPIPHSALQVPDGELTLYDNAWSDPPLNDGEYTPHMRPRAARAAMITLLDRQVGEIVSELEELGIRDDTLIVFTSDNGPAPEGGQNVEFFDSSGGLRGIKRDLYEGGIRVPMIVSWTSVVPQAQSTDHISAFWDVLPTFADISGAETPSDVDGISFAELLIDGAAKEEHEYLYWEFHGRSPAPARAIVKGNWKLIELNPDSEHAKLELYDLDEDPSESRNLIEERPIIAAELHDLVKSARVTSPHPGFNFDPDNAPADQYLGR